MLVPARCAHASPRAVHPPVPPTVPPATSTRAWSMCPPPTLASRSEPTSQPPPQQMISTEVGGRERRNPPNLPPPPPRRGGGEGGRLRFFLPSILCDGALLHAHKPRTSLLPPPALSRAARPETASSGSTWNPEGPKASIGATFPKPTLLGQNPPISVQMVAFLGDRNVRAGTLRAPGSLRHRRSRWEGLPATVNAEAPSPEVWGGDHLRSSPCLPHPPPSLVAP